MKKPFLIAITAVAIIASFVTCTKETISTQLPAVQPQQISTCLDYLNLTCSNTIPYYASVQDFEAAYDCLETDYEDYNDTYEAQYTSLDDDDYDDQVAGDNFNEEQPLNDYEATYYYTSLRTTLNTAEDTWLANNMAGSDPFDHAVADFIFMTLLNSDGDIRIGSNLYNFAASGNVIIVSNGDCNVFASAKASATYTNQYLQRIFPNNDECNKHKKIDGNEDFLNNDNRKFKWRIDFDSYIATSRAKTVVRNYRKKNNNWKRAASSTYVYIGGDVWDNECDDNSAMSYNDKIKRRKRVLTRRSLMSICKIKTEQVQGLVEQTEDGAYIDQTIDW